MNKNERIKWWEDHPDVHPAKPSTPAFVCHPLGTSSLVEDVPPVMLRAVPLTNINGDAPSQSDQSDEDDGDDDFHMLESYIHGIIGKDCS